MKWTCRYQLSSLKAVWHLQIDDVDLPEIGPLFERHQVFPARTNTEFVEVRPAHPMPLLYMMRNGLICMAR